jgi:4-hydroxybenzoate polyprenyltransferase
VFFRLPCGAIFFIFLQNWRGVCALTVKEMSIRKIFAFIKNEFVYGGHLLSLGAASIAFTAAALLGINITWDFLLIAYSIVYIAYSYNRLMEFKGDSLTNPLRTEHIGGYVRILPYGIAISFLLALWLLVEYGDLDSIIFMLFMVTGSLLYTILFKNLTKNIIGFKSFYVSLFWASLIILLSFYYESFLGISAILMFLFVFFRLVVNTVFFDIKDIDSDKLCGLKTLPAYLGKRKVLILIHILNMISFSPLILGVYAGFLPPVSLSLLLFYFYTFCYLELVKKDNSNVQKISYAIVDGEYVLWSLVLFYFKF